VSDRPRPAGASRGLARELLLLAVFLAALFGVSLFVVRLVAPPRAAAPGEPGALIKLAESRMRDLTMRSLEPQLVRDPDVTVPVEVIGARVFAALGAPGSPGAGRDKPTLVVLDTNTVNAFTLPGGVIVVCAGLLRSLGSSEELAAVIAHEAGHVANHDVSRTMARQMGLSALLSLFGAREAEVLVQRLLGELINQRYSREVEEKADATALRILERADIDPGALADAFTRLERTGEKAPQNVLKYLESHPDLEGRIARAREASREASLRHAGPWKPFDPQLWKRIRAAL
jgi:predicted Zn-dependent protease